MNISIVLKCALIACCFFWVGCSSESYYLSEGDYVVCNPKYEKGESDGYTGYTRWIYPNGRVEYNIVYVVEEVYGHGEGVRIKDKPVYYKGHVSGWVSNMFIKLEDYNRLYPDQKIDPPKENSGLYLWVVIPAIITIIGLILYHHAPIFCLTIKKTYERKRI